MIALLKQSTNLLMKYFNKSALFLVTLCCLVFTSMPAFAIDITEALWERAVEQNPELKELRQNYSFARSHFLDTLILENKLLFSIQLDKSKPLLSSKGDKR